MLNDFLNGILNPLSYLSNDRASGLPKKKRLAGFFVASQAGER